MENVNLYSKLMNMRVELQKKGIEKTGENKFSKFKYFELDDFLPQCNEIALAHKAVFLYQLNKEDATLTLINCENIEEKIIFSLPLAELTIQGANGIQNIGGLATYTRRYLYMIAFEISEKDEFDPNIQAPDNKQNTSEADHQRQVDNISKQKVSQAKVNVIIKEMEKVGVSTDQICDRYNLETLKDITEELFPRIMDALKVTARGK